MRISTAGLHNLALQGITDRDADLAKTQSQIATGKRIQSPADDPAAATQAVQLDRSLSESQQFGRNADVATNNLSLEEQALADSNDLLTSIRDLAVQANSGALDPGSRQAIATQLQAQLQQLVDLANRKNGNNEYLFSGFATAAQPFIQSAAGVSYVGDQNVRQLQTSQTQHVSVSDSGYSVFVNIDSGNGTFVTAANPANTGSGTIDAGSVTDPTAWVPGTYRLQFTSGTAYQVLDSTNAVVSSGTYTPGNSISFRGIAVNVGGQPATGDEFTVSPSSSQDVFTTVKQLIATVGSSTVTDAQRAQYSTRIAASLQQLDTSLDHINAVRSSVGARLSTLDQTQSTRADNEVTLQTSLSGLRDLDIAKAVTQLNLQQVGLQAAQASYARIAQLSLFNYLG